MQKEIRALSTAVANFYGPRPKSFAGVGLSDSNSRRRRLLIDEAASRADRELQIQFLFFCVLFLSLFYLPIWVSILGCVLSQISELHGLIVTRALFRDAQNPADDLARHQKPAMIYEFSRAIVIGFILAIGFQFVAHEHALGVLAVTALGLAFFTLGALHDRRSLYGTIGVVYLMLVIGILVRTATNAQMLVIDAVNHLAFVAFAIICSFLIAFNVRKNANLRLGYEEQLEKSIELARRESVAKSALLAQLSHEIRTPMNGVLGAAELLSYKSLNEEQTELLGVIRNSGRNLVSLLDRTLDLSAAEVGRINLKLAPTPLDSLLKEQVALFTADATAAGITLRHGSEVCDTPRLIDEVRVRQCLANLISNAIAHSESSEIVVTCSSDDGETVIIRVSDNGRGVPASRRDVIFRPFGSKELGHSRASKGAGLGLAISRGIAQAMGGDIVLEKSNDDGSVFALSFKAPVQT